MLGKLPKFYDENLLVGTETSDDAAVFRLSDDTALIQTVDFFPPVVDDPYLFGQIAAANSLSDVYAMGGEPRIALNIVGFPNCLDPEILAEILRGGADKVKEAQAVLSGGHTIQDEEPKYGLCVTGFVHPKHLWRNAGARPGDRLILTKPLGSGILTTAVKADLVSEEEFQEVARVMAALNQKAKRVLEHYEVHACTDITGFGLAGHGAEMAKASGVTIAFDAGKLPLITGALEYARMGIVPEGAYANGGYLEDSLCRMETVEEVYGDLILDPQTSGGLLASVCAADAASILADLKKAGLDVSCAEVGEVLERQEYSVILR